MKKWENDKAGLGNWLRRAKDEGRLKINAKTVSGKRIPRTKVWKINHARNAAARQSRLLIIGNKSMIITPWLKRKNSPQLKHVKFSTTGKCAAIHSRASNADFLALGREASAKNAHKQFSMFRTFTVVGGVEPTNTILRYMAAGYATPEQMISDLEMTKQLVIKSLMQRKPEEKFDVDKFLDTLNAEKRDQKSGE